MEQESRNKGGKFRTQKKPFPLWLVFLAVFLLGMAVSGYKILSAALEDNRADDAYAQLLLTTQQSQRQEKPTEGHEEPASQQEAEEAEAQTEPQRQQSLDFTQLLEASSDIVGWIRGEGIGIDYPILHGKDNEYYLTHLYDGSENANGSIFLDSRNTGLFTEPNTVIYGHNMQNGTMFHSLNEYKSQDFFDEYPSVIVFTPEGDYRVDFICGTVEDGNDEIFQFTFDDDADFQKYVASFQTRSTFDSQVTLEPGDKIITLCTCTYEQINARYALMGKVTELFQ